MMRDETWVEQSDSRTAPDGCEADIVLDRVVMSFGDRQVLGGLSCHFECGRISVILGGSGMGKTTILRLIGGLVAPAAGSIEVLGREITRLSERQMYEVRGDIGMMFQNGAMLDSLTVLDNLALPLREHTRLGRREIAEEVRACLASVGLSGVEGLLPRQLSGGMTKRVGLARALISKPRILLCDEPFSGLDPVSARRIELLLRSINEERRITIVVVSHDITSTMRMADHVVLLLPDGAFEGSPEALRASRDERVAVFLDADRALRNEAELPQVEAAAWAEDGRP
jgi:phospholipid/cholesterol/gamma-HCH transport system ATP-binding protein